MGKYSDGMIMFETHPSYNDGNIANQRLLRFNELVLYFGIGFFQLYPFQLSPFAKAIKDKDPHAALLLLQERGTGMSTTEALMILTNADVFVFKFSPDCFPNEKLRKYPGPETHIPCGSSKGFWKCLFDLPDVTILNTVAFGTVHCQYYVRQYTKLLSSMSELTDALLCPAHASDEVTELSIVEVLQREATKLLDGPSKPVPAAIMFYAGLLEKEVLLHMHDGEKLYSDPCLCFLGDRERVHLYMDRLDGTYFLLAKEL